MYHIKADKRAVNSSELLYRGLVACMGEKEFQKITITDIAEVSTVGRATFYRNFDEIVDILHWKCDQRFAEVLKSYPVLYPSTNDKSTLLLHVFTYWFREPEVLELLLAINRIDIIFHCFYQNSFIIIDYLKKEPFLADYHYDYFMSIRIGVFVGVLNTWIKNGKKENAKELTDIILNQLKVEGYSPFII